MKKVDGGGGAAKPNWYEKAAKTTELKDLQDEFKAFKALDADKNGKLSKDELKDAKGKKSEMFLAWDANDNGSVSWHEVAKGNSFTGLDGNKDGTLSGKEAESLKAYDADKDGKVSREEYLKGRKAEIREIGTGREGKEFAKLDGNEDGELTGTELKKVKQYDADKDGKVTKDEFTKGRAEEAKKAREESHTKAVDALLKKADKNQDGYLSGNEIKADWKQYDADKNGQLSKEELGAVEKAERRKNWEDGLMGADKPKADKPDDKDKDKPKADKPDDKDKPKADKTDGKGDDKKDKKGGGLESQLKSPYI